MMKTKDFAVFILSHGRANNVKTLKALEQSNYTGKTIIICDNEDVNCYIKNGMQGNLLFTIYKPSIIQTQTQSNSGGLTDIYLDNGTYVKSFYSVICEPSCAKVQVMNTKHPRIHHKILWNKCCPKIISDKYKK